MTTMAALIASLGDALLEVQAERVTSGAASTLVRAGWDAIDAVRSAGHLIEVEER